jgi:2-oxoglutarate dehydrogenase E1 component
MASDRDNKIFEKTSFLQGGNSLFIKELYLKYLKNPKSIPQSWSEFFDGLDEDEEVVKNEILGPSWAPEKNNNLKTNLLEEDLVEDVQSPINGTSISEENYDKEKEQSVKAIALIRAFRIRGHLQAHLDPLGMMERKYLHELHPADHGFKKEDYNKKIYIGEYMDRKYATIDELLSFLRKTYCSKIGVEYMHISDPIEKKWFRERMEKKENQLNFTDTGKK